MREALQGLTTRGRAFLAAGVTTILCAIVLGQPALTRVGVLVAALPLVTAVVLARSRFDLALTRTVRPRQVSVGRPARVELLVTNQGKAPRGALMLEERVPYALGARPRFVLEGVGVGWRRHVDYVVRSDVRGYYEVGPMRVRASDPFGMVEVNRTVSGASGLTVTPRVLPLASISLGGGWSGAGENRPRAFATGSAEDVTVRDYRRGDDLRRVHWPSSARVGELMVRREEQPWQARATVLLDDRQLAHRGTGAASSLETAVTAAASVASHLCRRGFVVRLVTASGEQVGGARHERDAAASIGSMLDALAVVRPLPRGHLDLSWLGEHAFGGLTVAVLGAVVPTDSAALRRIQLDADVALCLGLDVATWTVGGPAGAQVSPSPDGSARLLAGLGWRTAGLASGGSIAAAWQELGRGGGARSTAAATSVDLGPDDGVAPGGSALAGSPTPEEPGAVTSLEGVR